MDTAGKLQAIRFCATNGSMILLMFNCLCLLLELGKSWPRAEKCFYEKDELWHRLQTFSYLMILCDLNSLKNCKYNLKEFMEILFVWIAVKLEEICDIHDTQNADISSFFWNISDFPTSPNNFILQNERWTSTVLRFIDVMVKHFTVRRMVLHIAKKCISKYYFFLRFAYRQFHLFDLSFTVFMNKQKYSSRIK